jgi:hypothetical protein
MMPDMQHFHELGEAATIDILAAVIIERFGDRAVAVATDQLAAAHAFGGHIADRWLSILMSVENRLDAEKAVASTGVPPSTAGQT